MSEREFGRLIKDDGWRRSSLVRWPAWLRAQGLHDALLRLIALDFSRRVAWLTLFALILFPTSYFLLAPYSETLFLLLVVVTFYFYRQRRFLPAGIAGVLVSATRIMGPLVCGALLLALARRWRQQTLTQRRGQPSRSLRALLSEFPDLPFVLLMPLGMRSEERRVGKECRAWRAQDHEKLERRGALKQSL